MSHNYFFDTQEYLEKQMAEARATLESSGQVVEKRRFAEGRLEALTEFQIFLNAKVTPKLPRRLLKKMGKSPGG